MAGTERVLERYKLEQHLLREYRIRLIADVVTGKLDVRESAARLPGGSDDAEDDAHDVDATHEEDDDQVEEMVESGE